MRKILLLFISIVIIGCEGKIINYYEITVVDDIAYLKKDMTLVNGKVKKTRLVVNNQKLWAEYRYREGKLNGISKMYAEGGILFSEIPYMDGRIEGIMKMYENGILFSETPYIYGHQVGGIRAYYENGQLKSENPKKVGGEFYGVGKEWHENGQLKMKVTYKHGKPFELLRWDENGVQINN